MNHIVRRGVPNPAAVEQRGVLVTGSNRSGTTWVGEMLCHSGRLRGVYEPFNPGLWPRWTPERIPHRNLYVCDENEDQYLEPMSDILARRRPLLAQLGDVRSPRDAARIGRDLARGVRDRSVPVPSLVKDPIALFSAPWLYRRFDLQVVVMIRNPAAFVSSIKRLDWRFDFRNWLDQDLLMRDLLAPYSADIHRMVRREHDVVDEAILQWRVFYHVVDQFRSEFPNWHFVRWESLAQDPIPQFRRLYESLGLPLTEQATRRIERDTRSGNTRQVASHEAGTIRRDSRAVAGEWRHRLEPFEFERVRDGAGDVAERYYRPEEWAYVGDEADGVSSS